MAENSEYYHYEPVAIEVKDFETEGFVLDVGGGGEGVIGRLKGKDVIAIDYRKDDFLTREFFATVQNKIHFAVHGKTAAELINERVNAKKQFMGLTNFDGKYITTRDISIAKNYLTEEELKQLNLIVTLYLDFAELQATNKKYMKMADWIQKLDDFLKISDIHKF